MTIKFTVPLVPPSVNHYKQKSSHGHWYVTKEAMAFKDAVATFAPAEAKQRVKGKRERYQVEYRIFLGKGERLDWDNGNKVLGDALQECGVIRSDAAITAGSVWMGRDIDNPRTEIEVVVL